MTAMMSIVKNLISLLLSKKLLFPGYLFCDMNEQFFLINIYIWPIFNSNACRGQER